jgi:hypothetical protein
MQLVASCDVLRLAYRPGNKKRVYFITVVTAMPKKNPVV